MASLPASDIRGGNFQPVLFQTLYYVDPWILVEIKDSFSKNEHLRPPERKRSVYRRIEKHLRQQGCVEAVALGFLLGLPMVVWLNRLFRI